jgi:hypothetical protein
MPVTDHWGARRGGVGALSGGVDLNFDDFVAIRELSARFARAFDDGDEAGWLGTFAPDGGLRGASGLEVRGHDELSAFFRSASHETQHVTTDPVIEVTGSEASQVSSFIVFRKAEGQVHLLAAGRYLDSLVRTPDGWRFAMRVART